MEEDRMRKIMLAVLGLGLTGSLSGTAMNAQAPATNAIPNVPTIKVLALGRLTAAATPTALAPIMSSEVPATVKLYLAGKIDQWYSRKDQRGVVFVMNVTSVEEAHALLEKLPLGVAKLMEFDLIPLGPLAPLATLVNKPAAEAGK
jgi:hypothetical protein